MSPASGLAARPNDDLGNLIQDGSIRDFFEMSQLSVSQESAFANIEDGDNLDTIVVVECGFFPNRDDQELFKEKLVGLGVPPNHVLFGDDFPSGYHHTILRIHELSNS